MSAEADGFAKEDIQGRLNETGMLWEHNSKNFKEFSHHSLKRSFWVFSNYI